MDSKLTLEEKAEIYFKYARLPEDDGTFQDYYYVFMEHQQIDRVVLKRACQEFSEYVRFCMNVIIYYKSKTTGEYKQVFFNEEDIDRSDFELYLISDGISISMHTDLKTIDYPNIEGLIEMSKIGVPGYAKVFNSLLDGRNYLELEGNVQ